MAVRRGEAAPNFLLSRMVMRRLGQALMSRDEVVEKHELFRSEVLLRSARMAAHGSGAAAQSMADRSDLVNVDIGGGTIKFTLLSKGGGL